MLPLPLETVLEATRKFKALDTSELKAYAVLIRPSNEREPRPRVTSPKSLPIDLSELSTFRPEIVKHFDSKSSQEYGVEQRSFCKVRFEYLKVSGVHMLNTIQDQPEDRV